MNKSLATIGLGLLVSVSASADSVFGVYGGVNVWNQNYDGSLRDLNTGGILGTDIDFERDLGFDDENGNVIYVAVEHAIPVLPNIKIQYTELEIDANQMPTQQIEYGGETFTATANINSEADLSHTDLTMYWQALDNWVSLDLGLTIRFFDGFVQIQETSGATSAREDFDAPVPLIYAAARFDLPLSGMYAGINANFLGDGDNNFLDFQATVGYESKLRFGVEAGYRSLSLELDDIDDIEADLTIDGAFIGLFFHL